jgi:hypothetical protein
MLMVVQGFPETLVLDFVFQPGEVAGLIVPLMLGAIHP